jgi:DNA-binding SARP family transcriptional activator
VPAGHARRDPWNEAGQRLLIAALQANGQRGEAARQYRSCRRTLQRELGIEPAPETEELAARLFAVNPIMEALRLDREVLAKLLVRMEDIITSRRVGMKSLEEMRDVIKARLGEHLAPAPGRSLLANRPGGTGPKNGAVGVELRA